MNCGSIAIALSAEYGDISPGGISLIGSSCKILRPAVSSQRTIEAMSPISPMPQLRDEGIENSGMSAPARREPGLGGVIRWFHASCNRNAAVRLRIDALRTQHIAGHPASLHATFPSAAADSSQGTSHSRSRKNTQGERRLPPLREHRG